LAPAYTPGLKLAARTMVRKRRALPLQGKVLVQAGQQVQAGTVVAQAELPGPVHPVNVVNRLGVPPEEVHRHMLVKEGDRIEEDQVIAQTRPLIKWFKTVCRSPAAGTVESVSKITGQVMVRERPRKVNLRAYIAGTVAEVMPQEGVVIETKAALVQGIFGLGGECFGRLNVVANSATAVVKAGALDSTCQNCIIVVGSLATASLVRAAQDYGAAAVVAGGMPAQDLKEIVGHEIGVAVTGSEQIGLTVVLTEGFGRIPMAARTFELLTALEGQQASASGATQIRAGVLRPEIIVPLVGPMAKVVEGEPTVDADGLKKGDGVRIIREPYFGMIAQVDELIADPVRIETEATVRVLRVRTERGEVLEVPRANVEIIKG